MQLTQKTYTQREASAVVESSCLTCGRWMKGWILKEV